MRLLLRKGYSLIRKIAYRLTAYWFRDHSEYIDSDDLIFVGLGESTNRKKGMTQIVNVNPTTYSQVSNPSMDQILLTTLGLIV